MGDTEKEKPRIKVGYSGLLWVGKSLPKLINDERKLFMTDINFYYILNKKPYR